MVLVCTVPTLDISELGEEKGEGEKEGERGRESKGGIGITPTFDLQSSSPDTYHCHLQRW